MILTVGLTPETCALAAESARVAWGTSDVVAFASVEEVLAHRTHEEMELVVLGSSVPMEECQRAAAQLSPDGLPRWPVVVLAEGPAHEALWHLPSELCTVPGLAYALQAAAKHHSVVRDACRARGDLWTIARRISHELRSPIGCIITSADVIREEMEDLVPAAGALAQPILDSAKEVMDLVERLTLVARATAVPPRSESVDMGMVTWAVRERLMPLINHAGAEITEPEEWPHITGRTEWLEAIWTNLLTNALKHAGAQPRIQLGWKRTGEEIRFHVQDHGSGVAPAVIPSLLRPFNQLHQHDSGRGLGLAIVQRLVELQGGRAGYEPGPLRGSRFFFTLPEASTSESA